MKYQITEAELTRRKRHTVRVMVAALGTFILIAYPVMRENPSQFLVTASIAIAMSLAAGLFGMNSMLKALRNHEVEITESHLILPIQHGLASIPWDSIKKVEMEDLAAAGPAARLHIKGLKQTRLVGYHNMKQLLEELLSHIPEDRVDTRRIRTKH